MTDQSLINSPDEVGGLSVGQWVIAANGRRYCLVDTYVGWPQRMWMSPGGVSNTGIPHVVYPLRLADLDEPDAACPHAWGTQEMGHCKRCGRVVAAARPAPASQQELDRLRAVLSAVEGGDPDAA